MGKSHQGCHPNLLQIALASQVAGRLTRLLNSWKRICQGQANNAEKQVSSTNENPFRNVIIAAPVWKIEVAFVIQLNDADLETRLNRINYCSTQPTFDLDWKTP